MRLSQSETFVERKVRYVLDHSDGLFIVENVPARVNMETGEQLFSPDVVERLQRIAWQKRAQTHGANAGL